MDDFKFSRKMRLSKEKEISRVFVEGEKRSNSLLTVFDLKNSLEHSRFCLIVSKRNWGKKAVQRNRVKRLLRETVRLSRHSLESGKDFVIIANRRKTVPTLADYRKSIGNLIGKLPEG